MRRDIGTRTGKETEREELVEAIVRAEHEVKRARRRLACKILTLEVLVRQALDGMGAKGKETGQDSSDESAKG